MPPAFGNNVHLQDAALTQTVYLAQAQTTLTNTQGSSWMALTLMSFTKRGWLAVQVDFVISHSNHESYTQALISYGFYCFEETP